MSRFATVEMLKQHASPETVLDYGKRYRVKKELADALVADDAARIISAEEIANPKAPQVVKQPKPDPEDELSGENVNVARRKATTPDDENTGADTDMDDTKAPAKRTRNAAPSA